MEVRINVAAPGSHHQSFLGRQPHRDIHALTIPDRCRAASISKMRGNKLGLLDRFAKPLGRLQYDKMMAGSVESVPADSVLFVVFVWNRVVKGMRRQCLVKRSIEHGHLLLIWK